MASTPVTVLGTYEVLELSIVFNLQISVCLCVCVCVLMYVCVHVCVMGDMFVTMCACESQKTLGIIPWITFTIS